MHDFARFRILLHKHGAGFCTIQDFTPQTRCRILHGAGCYSTNTVHIYIYITPQTPMYITLYKHGAGFCPVQDFKINMTNMYIIQTSIVLSNMASLRSLINRINHIRLRFARYINHIRLRFARYLSSFCLHQWYNNCILEQRKHLRC